MRLGESTFNKKKLALAVASVLAASSSASVFAQGEEELVVTGIRASLTRAMDIKREANGVVDSISAEDVGKFPDLNVAESLQRVTGVAIDRSSGEGQQITVRGFGPQFNTVLVNGRQLASDAQGRSFNFDVLSADMITGADIYKSTKVDLQEGAIGATVNLSTARPMDNPGFQAAFSVKGLYETLSEETAPTVSGLVSSTFADDTVGVLLAFSHAERDLQLNRIQTAGWRPGIDLVNATNVTVASGQSASNVYFPRNWDQIVQSQDRTRDNANLVLQFAPNDDLTITLDGWVSNLEVDLQTEDLASWFEPSSVSTAVIDENGTAVMFDQSTALGGPASDQVPSTRGLRDVSSSGFGLNVDWNINDNLAATFDISTSESEDDVAGDAVFSVLGFPNNYTFDGRGNIPTVIHEGFGNGNLPAADGIRIHYQERGDTYQNEDEITEFKVDLEYTADSDVFQKAKFGAYRQEREKDRFRDFAGACDGIYCSYQTALPASVRDDINLRPFTAENYFSGLIDTWYTFDADVLQSYLRGLPDTAADYIVPSRAPDAFTVSEDVTSLYMDFTFGFDLGDMPLTINAGARYATTTVDVEAIQAPLLDVVATGDITLFGITLDDAQTINSGTKYADLLPSVTAKLDLNDDMVLRAAVYDSMARPTMAQMSPSTTFNSQPRRQSLVGTGGNSELVPFKSENWDLSYEWYYSDDSLMTFAFFNKEVENFITVQNFQETYVLNNRTAADGFRCAAAECAPGAVVDPANPGGDFVLDNAELNGQSEVYTISRPSNNETPNTVTGYEAALTHIFDFGLGVTVNATVVDSAEGEGSLTGLGDSQNLVVFYEQERWQARVAFNNREAFLSATSQPGQSNEPVTTDTYGQVDISASFDITDNLTVFFEGTNVTEEELSRFTVEEERIIDIEDNGARYALGIRGSF